MLDQVIVLSKQHFKWILVNYVTYYHSWRTHLSLTIDCPEPGPVHPPELGKVIAVPEVGGLHRHYEQQTACMGGFATRCFIDVMGIREPQPRGAPAGPLRSMLAHRSLALG